MNQNAEPPIIEAEVFDDARTLRVHFNAAAYFEGLTDEQLEAFIALAPQRDAESDKIAECCARSDLTVSNFFARKPALQANGKDQNGFECEYDLEAVIAYANNRTANPPEIRFIYSMLSQQLRRWNELQPNNIFRRTERHPDHKGTNQWCMVSENGGFSAILENSPVNTHKIFALLAKNRRIPDDVIAAMLNVYFDHLETLREASPTVQP